MLLAIYNILKHKQQFVDLGSNYYNTVNTEKIMNRHIKSLEKLGFEVSVLPLSVTA
jgi:transposase